MRKGIAIASALALFAAPLTAQSVPLNTVSGGEGSEQVTGQGVALAGLGVAGTTAAAIVVTTIALVAVASEESATTN